ncbi:hypothetical protein LXL04_027648 [Taraxacum kok-saghyz]
MEKSLRCPGFRFKPTDVELAMYYLKKKLSGKKLSLEVISEINIYDFSPWDLPAKSILSGDLEWYFFCPQSKKYSSGSRKNRATESGYWKSTGKDRGVKYNERTVATIKTLVFHLGHPPKGTRTNWVMHEYRMNDDNLAKKGVAQDAYVICKVFEKSGLGPKNGAQYGAPFEEEEWEDDETWANPNNASCSGVKNMTSTEPGPSTVTSCQNERLIDTPFNPDDMLTLSDITSLHQNNNIQDVENGKGKEVISDDGVDIFKELAASNLDDLDQIAFDMFYVDGSNDDDDNFQLPDDDFWKFSV